MLRFSAFLLLDALLFWPLSASAQTPSPASEKTETFTIVNGDLLTALVRLERQYHIQCVLRDGVDANSKINISLSDVPLSLTLRLLASSANAQVTQSPDGVYMFAPKVVVVSGDPNHSLPLTHFINGSRSLGFGWINPLQPSFGFGYINFLQQNPVVFLHRAPAGASALVSKPGEVETTETSLPGEPRRIFALGQSF